MTESIQKFLDRKYPREKGEDYIAEEFGLGIWEPRNEINEVLLIGGTDGCPDCLEGSLDLRDFKNLLGLNCYNENNDPAFKITEIDLSESQNVYILNVEIEGEKYFSMEAELVFNL